MVGDGATTPIIIIIILTIIVIIITIITTRAHGERRPPPRPNVILRNINESETKSVDPSLGAQQYTRHV